MCRRNSIPFLLGILLAVAPAAVAEEIPGLGQFVESIGKEEVEKKKVTGLSIGVAIGDDVLVAEGFGLANVELNAPATAETVYRIGSLTKQFTAAAVMRLIEDGKLLLDDPLNKHLPKYPTAGGKATIGQLLQHTSGIADFTRLPDYRKNRPLHVTQQQVLDRFQNLPLDFHPGEKHRYCNSGYFLLGLVVEAASGNSFREYVEQELFQKAGLKQTYCDNATRIIPGRASGYSRWTGELKNATPISLSQAVGAGDLAATVTDLIRWQRALFTHRLLKKESLEQMISPGKLNSDKAFNYGFGLRIASLGNLKVIRHGGGINGFRSDLAYYPDIQLTIAVLSNCEHANTKKVSDRIARQILAELNKR